MGECFLSLCQKSAGSAGIKSSYMSCPLPFLERLEDAINEGKEDRKVSS